MSDLTNNNEIPLTPNHAPLYKGSGMGKLSISDVEIMSQALKYSISLMVTKLLKYRITSVYDITPYQRELTYTFQQRVISIVYKLEDGGLYISIDKKIVLLDNFDKELFNHALNNATNECKRIRAIERYNEDLSTYTSMIEIMKGRE